MRRHPFLYLPFGLRGAWARSEAATVFSDLVDFLRASPFAAFAAGFLAVGIDGISYLVL
jgi:hypothetical protein